MYNLNEITKKNIELKTGLNVEEIENMDFDEIDKAIEKKIKKKLSYLRTYDDRLSGRGSVYLFLNRFLNFGKQ